MKKFKNPWVQKHKRTLTAVSSMKRTEGVDYDSLPYAGGANNKFIENASFQNGNNSIFIKNNLNSSSEKQNITGKLRLMLNKSRGIDRKCSPKESYS